MSVASFLFILTEHSIILIPASPTVTGQEQQICQAADAEPSRRMQTCRDSAWGIRQHLGHVSSAIPRPSIRQLTNIISVKNIHVVPISTRALGWPGAREKQRLRNSQNHTLADILIYHVNKFTAKMPRTQEPIPHATGKYKKKTVTRWKFKQNKSHLQSKLGKSGRFPPKHLAHQGCSMMLIKQVPPGHSQEDLHP